MRILNTNQNNNKKYTRFSLPGFRSGSMLKKIIACVYYCFVFFYIIINGISTIVTTDFGGTSDVLLFILYWILAILVFVSPIIIVGFSDYFDLHGIKLFLVVMLAMILFVESAKLVSTFFSDEMKGISPQIDQAVTSSSEISPELPAETVEKHTAENDSQSDSEPALPSDAN